MLLCLCTVRCTPGMFGHSQESQGLMQAITRVRGYARSEGRWAMRAQCVVCRLIHRVGHNRIHTPYMTVYLVISLPKILYIHRIYMFLANPTYTLKERSQRFRRTAWGTLWVGSC